MQCRIPGNAQFWRGEERSFSFECFSLASQCIFLRFEKSGRKRLPSYFLKIYSVCLATAVAFEECRTSRYVEYFNRDHDFADQTIPMTLAIHHLAMVTRLIIFKTSRQRYSLGESNTDLLPWSRAFRRRVSGDVFLHGRAKGLENYQQSRILQHERFQQKLGFVQI